MEEQIKKQVCIANKSISESGLVFGTWGNVSQIDSNNEFIYIKPSGVSFKELIPEKIVKIDLNGFYKDSSKPSVDSPAHIEIYKGLKEVKSIVHTHSEYATAFAQAKIPIPCLGTTHADHFFGEIPLIPGLENEELGEYTKNLGKKIVKYFKEKEINPLETPACLIPNHGVFVFGETAEKAVENAMILEQVARLAYRTIVLSQNYGRHREIETSLLERHFKRKHGKDKYYGQENQN